MGSTSPSRTFKASRCAAVQLVRSPLTCPSWRAVRHTPNTQLDLENTKADALWDDEASWPAPGKLMIDGFIYTEFAGGPAEADPRLGWLERQPPGYRPQPYRQLARSCAMADARPEP